MPTVHPCLSCGVNIRLRQQYLTCVLCSGWQHRTCTGFTQGEYREGIIALKCSRCHAVDLEAILNTTTSTIVGPPQAESTALEFMDSESYSQPPVMDQISQAQQVNEEHTCNQPELSEYNTDIPRINVTDSRIHSFNIERPYDIPDRFTEDTVREATLPMDITEASEEPLSYTVLPGASQRGNSLLSDSDGFIYTKKKSNSTSTTWTCKLRCGAMVIQTGDSFSSGHTHSHLAKPGEVVQAKVSTSVKSMAKSELFKPGSNIVEDVVIDAARPTAPGNSQLVVSNLIRTVNRVRQQLRPEEPTDLAFELNEQFIPENFLQRDITLNGARHLVLATPEQLQLLEQSKTWYLDGTFKIINFPFTQLFSIHAFMKGDSGEVKQVPLLYTLMSRRSRVDYVAVFDCVKELVPDCIVKKFVLDFELAVWKAAPAIFPEVKLVGCVFHWTQAVWRKVQELGLATSYNTEEAVHDYIRKLLALPFLPNEHITEAFDQLAARATPAVEPLVRYIRATWIDSSTWTPASWSIFNQPIRTNNDVEGWHRRMNSKAGRTQLQMYLLIPLLHRESKLVSINRRLVKDGKLRRYQRRVYKASSGKIIKYWEEYEAGTLTTSRLLKKISKMIKV